jgi:hypothetical protein
VDFGRLLRHTWDIVWEHKFLIFLGILVALGSGGGTNTSTGGSGFNFNFDQPDGDFVFPTPPSGELPEMPEIPDSERLVLPVVGTGVLVVLGGLALAVGIALWVVSTIARGGLIAGASTIDAGGVSDFSTAWQAGWQKGWRLLGISVLPAIPGLFLFVVGIFAFLTTAILSVPFGTDIAVGTGLGLGGLLTTVACILVPISMVLGLLQFFANRACMLEDLGVFASYGRGFNVLIENIGPVIVLFLIQVALNIVIGLVLLVPGIVFALCCILWPLLLAIQGAIAAYFSTLWTLAWREWTGKPHAVEATI